MLGVLQYSSSWSGSDGGGTTASEHIYDDSKIVENSFENIRISEASQSSGESGEGK